MDNLDTDDLLEQAKQLVHRLESEPDNCAGITEDIGKITAIVDDPLFQKLGVMTREIHEAILQFGEAPSVTDMVESGIPDAKDRLTYVIEMTQDAANKTLGIVEEGTDITHSVKTDLNRFAELWSRFRHKDMEAEEFRELTRCLETFFHDSTVHMDNLKFGFNEVLMAQEFQDLTGQIIRQVIELVDDVEGKLVELLRIQAEHQPKISQKQADSTSSDGEVHLEGPQVPGKGGSDVVSGQDEVDDLLASLGF